MVGQVRDELRPAVVEFQSIDENTIVIEGSLSIEEAREELRLDVPEGPYDTFAGFLLSALGHIPATGEQLPLDGMLITITEMKGPKIETVRVQRLVKDAHLSG
jgi:putative hemolysin